MGRISLPCNCNQKLLEVVFCGFLEVDAETEFGVQDIYEGLTPVEGRGQTQDWAEGEVGRQQRSAKPRPAPQELWSVYGPSELSSLWLKRLGFIPLASSATRVDCLSKGMFLGVGWLSVAEANPEASVQPQLPAQHISMPATLALP